jgi:putative ABC transport system substrate-binding protein
MNRRDTVLALFALGAAPLAAKAQQAGKVWRVGFLVSRRVGSLASDYYGGFPRGMRELGYVEGKNLVIEWRSAEGKYERFPGLAAELVRLKVDIIVTAGPQATKAAQRATKTIPIVIGSTQDPVGSGFVKSLARPGGNITGLSNLGADFSPKHLEMLLTILPKLSRVAVLGNPASASHGTVLKNVRDAAQSMRIKVLAADARTPQEIESAFSMMARDNAEAVIVAADAFFIQQGRQIAELAVKNRLPTVSGFREHVESGGLMSYGPNLTESYRRAASYVDKIFKGAKPSDLPVEQANKFELIINMKTTKALGLTIPKTLLFQADRVIE